MYFKFFVKGNYLHYAKSHLISIFIMIFVLVRYNKNVHQFSEQNVLAILKPLC
jgi:hypothetical protein